MRPIKFRAFINHKVTRYPEDIVYWEVHNNPPGLGNLIPGSIGQFTGLLDKNRKEIYEGDILSSRLGNKHQVKWINACFHLVNMKKVYGPRTYALAPNVAKCKIVVGNIHSTPDLLK